MYFEDSQNTNNQINCECHRGTPFVPVTGKDVNPWPRVSPARLKVSTVTTSSVRLSHDEEGRHLPRPEGRSTRKAGPNVSWCDVDPRREVGHRQRQKLTRDRDMGDTRDVGGLFYWCLSEFHRLRIKGGPDLWPSDLRSSVVRVSGTVQNPHRRRTDTTADPEVRGDSTPV